MFSVKITYKSGKVEIAEIPINEYSAALVKLAEEDRMTSIRIVGVSSE